MSGKSGDVKGAGGEREFAALVRAHGFDARRGGRSNLQDIVHDVPGIWFEVKRQENVNLTQALAQAAKDCPEDHIPVVAYRRNGQKWCVTMDAEDLLNLIYDFTRELNG